MLRVVPVSRYSDGSEQEAAPPHPSLSPSGGEVPEGRVRGCFVSPSGNYFWQML